MTQLLPDISPELLLCFSALLKCANYIELIGMHHTVLMYSNNCIKLNIAFLSL